MFAHELILRLATAIYRSGLAQGSLRKRRDETRVPLTLMPQLNSEVKSTQLSSFTSRRLVRPDGGGATEIKNG
jgi:hypothetical protein